MKKLLLFAAFACFAVLFSSSVRAADTVVPQALDGGKLYRLTTSIEFSTNAYYAQGASFQFTNMTCYSSGYSTNPTVQGLDGVSVDVAWATSSSATGSTWYAGTVQVATSGTWCCTLTNMPASSSVYWQCRLTDAATNVYYYQQQMLRTNPHL
jgi:hypothetical protein